MLKDGESLEDLARLAVPLVGALEETGDRWLPFRLTDPAGAAVTSHGSSEVAPARSSAHDGAVPPNRAADWRSFTGQPLAEFTAVD